METKAGGVRVIKVTMQINRDHVSLLKPSTSLVELTTSVATMLNVLMWRTPLEESRAPVNAWRTSCQMTLVDVKVSSFLFDI